MHKRRRLAPNFTDEWLPVCEFCPLPDCVRAEGQFRPNHRDYRFRGCLIAEADRRGLKPGEVLENYGKFIGTYSSEK